MTTFFLDDDFDFDFKVIGISSYGKDYRVGWAINSTLNISLEKDKEIQLKNKKKGQLSEHSVYTYFDEETENEYRLISNKTLSGYLVNDQKQADYFLIIKEVFELNINEIIIKLKSINIILTAFYIDLATLKQKENLIF